MLVRMFLLRGIGRRSWFLTFGCWCLLASCRGADTPRPLPKIHIAPDGRTFVTADGTRFVPFGVNYYRPDTGWAPQMWSKFDAGAVRADFERMRDLGVNCVRVFLTYAAFCKEPGKLEADGLAKFEQFLAMAEAAGIYVHPTGLDHWEPLPDWAKVDRVADEAHLNALAEFWKLFAARYRGRSVIFAYDLRNEPEVQWDNAVMREKWNHWLAQHYGTLDKLVSTWHPTNANLSFGNMAVPGSPRLTGSREVLDYQLFREDVADEWTRRQVSAIKAADSNALVTVGLIQWSIPSLLPRLQNYSGFRPARQARLLDFLEIHFYPFENGTFSYGGSVEEGRNLAYLEGLMREVALPGKPVILAEYGWYGGGKPKFGGVPFPAASEEQQAQFCRRIVKTSEGFATGWLNWGLYDVPQANDVSQLTGVLTASGQIKAWGHEFKKLAAHYKEQRFQPKRLQRPALDWNACLTNGPAARRFRQEYLKAYNADPARAN